VGDSHSPRNVNKPTEVERHATHDSIVEQVVSAFVGELSRSLNHGGPNGEAPLSARQGTRIDSAR